MGTDFTCPKTWVLLSRCASTKQSCCLAVVQPIPAACSRIQPCVSPASTQIHSCGKTGVVHKKNGLCAESTPGCSTPSRPAQRCQYISTAPWWQHAFFFSCAQHQQVSVQVLEPIFPWRGREGGRRPAQEQEDGIIFKGGGSGISRATSSIGVM